MSPSPPSLFLEKALSISLGTTFPPLAVTPRDPLCLGRNGHVTSIRPPDSALPREPSAQSCGTGGKNADREQPRGAGALPSCGLPPAPAAGTAGAPGPRPIFSSPGLWLPVRPLALPQTKTPTKSDHPRGHSLRTGTQAASLPTVRAKNFNQYTVKAKMRSPQSETSS